MRTERWVPRDGGFEAVKLTRENLEEAAKWCGGEIGTRTNPVAIDDAYDTVLRFPTLIGVVQAGIGDYLIRKDDGKFDYWTESALLSQYKKVGRRQDGPQLTQRGSGEAYGAYTDKRHQETQGEMMQRLGW